MKIGYFINHFPYCNASIKGDLQYHCGGAENAAYNLAIQMANRGHEVKIFTTSPSPSDSIEKFKGISVYRYGTNFKISSSNISSGLFYKPIDHDLDIVHTHFDMPPTPLAGLLYARKNNVPLVLTYHGDWNRNFGCHLRRLGVYLSNKYFVNRLLSGSNIIISPSKSYIDESCFLKNYKNKISVIPNGVNLADFEISLTKEECRKKLNIPYDAKVILFFSYLTPYKGPDVLVKAMCNVIENVEDALLIFAGKGIMLDELSTMTELFGLENNVRFAGYVKDELKPVYYKSADIFCLPSTMNTEVFPLVLLEAAASRLPVVVSDLLTFKCIVNHGSNGIMTKRNNHNDLSEALIKLLKDNPLRGQMGENSYQKVMQYTWENVAEEIEKTYSEIQKSLA